VQQAGRRTGLKGMGTASGEKGGKTEKEFL